MSLLHPTSKSQDVVSIPATELAAFDARSLFQLKTLAADRLATAKAEVDHIEHALNLKYAERAKHLRLVAGKDSGVVHFDDGDVRITADLPKKVEYDQDRLRQAIAFLLNWGEDPDNYVVTEYKVPESRFAAWPPKIRELFEPARTVRSGKPAYKLEAVAAEPAATFCEEA